MADRPVAPDTASLNDGPSAAGQPAGEMRGQVVALYYVVIILAGLILGPITVGILSDSVFGEENLEFAVACVPLVFGLPVLMLMCGERRVCREEFARYDG